MNVSLTEWPTEADWLRCKRRALVTIGKHSDTPPTEQWKRSMLRCRHSPIRCLHFSFALEGIPYWVSTHFVRHVHAQPYISTQRNDRQNAYDRTEAPQGAEVDMIWDMNAEEFLTICNKRLCSKASPETRAVVERMTYLVLDRCPEFAAEMVPACVRQGGVCHEINPCGRCDP